MCPGVQKDSSSSKIEDFWELESITTLLMLFSKHFQDRRKGKISSFSYLLRFNLIHLNSLKIK